MKNPLKVGIIGAGLIAKEVHIPNYQKCENVEVVAVVNHHIEKAKQCAEQFNIRYTFSEVQEMLEKVELDAISICTPNKFHADQTIAALQANCHVLCEKPPAMSIQEAKAMEEAAEKAGKILSYGFHYRHTSEVETLKRFIEKDELGHIYAAKATAVRRRGIPGWGVFTNKELQGGGPLIDIGVHMLDTALHLMGYPEPTTVLGSTYQEIGNRQGVGLLGDWDWKGFSVEDMARGMITFNNGASLIIESAFAANVEKQEEMNVSLYGNKGGADLFPLKMYQEKYDTLLDVTPRFLPDHSAHEKLIFDFVQACQTGKKPSSTAKQGVILQQIIHGLYQSAQNNKPVLF